MNNYSFIIPNKKRNIYFVFAIGIIVLNMLGFALYDYRTNGYNGRIPLFLATFTAFLLLVFYISSLKKRFEFAGTVILLFGIFWISRGYYQVFIADLILWGLYTISRRELIIIVNRNNVSYPSFPVRKINWSDIKNLVLKDDILTIDLNNNKIYQPLVQYLGSAIEEQEFNEFCKEQIKL